jgi:hypothetical protein
VEPVSTFTCIVQRAGIADPARSRIPVRGRFEQDAGALMNNSARIETVGGIAYMDEAVEVVKRGW